jgi:phytoene synthase
MGLAAFVRAHDPDRFLCSLFAPAGRREALWGLYAFNHELARAQEVAREPGLALIRLQWWREVVEGQARRHEVANPVLALIEAGLLPAPALLGLIEAREAAVEQGAPATMAAFVAAMRAGPGALAAVSGDVLGADAAERAALVGLGAAYGVAGSMRNAAVMARLGRCDWPEDVLALAGLTREAAVGDPVRALSGCGAVLREAGLALAGGQKRWRRAVVAAALPGMLARRDLRRVRPVAARGVGDRVAVVGAAIAGVV